MCGFYQTNVNTNENFLVQSLQKDKSRLASEYHHLSYIENTSKQSKAVIDYTSPTLCTPVTPFPLIGDAAYRQHTGGGLSHVHRQHAEKVWQRSRMWFRRYPVGQIERQTDRHTDRCTHQSTLQLLPQAK